MALTGWAPGASQLDDNEEVTEEVFARRALARQRQITIGKSRPEYKLYASSIPYHRRNEHMPHTPDPHARISKRAFDRELACWRRGLHVCSAQLENSNAAHKVRSGDAPPEQVAEKAGLEENSTRLSWADWSPAKDSGWSPAGTESTRADSEASSPPNRTQYRPQGSLAPNCGKHSNVKLKLFDHLSAPLPTQSVLHPASTAGSAPAVPSVLCPTVVQAIPTPCSNGAWEMYPAGLNTGSVVGMMPGAGTAPAPMVQFAAVEQPQCGGYNMPYAWGGEMSPWTAGQQSVPQAQPVDAWQQSPTGQHAIPQVQSIASVSSPELQMQQQPQQQQPMWHQPSVSQRAAPGTPRASKNQVEETPSTPLHRVVRSAASPAMPSPYHAMLRTPSPDHAHYNMTHFKASQQPRAPNITDADPWASTTLMVITQNYYAEAEGYLSVSVGSEARAMIDNPHCGSAKSAWPTYVYCQQGSSMGWVPKQILWKCYVDGTGRRWACDDATGTWCWVDEMDKTAA